MADRGEWVSLAFQMCASSCWAVGAGLAGPEGAADYLQFAAALAWCVANLASLFSMTADRHAAWCARLVPVRAPARGATAAAARGAHDDEEEEDGKGEEELREAV